MKWKAKGSTNQRSTQQNNTHENGHERTECGAAKRVDEKWKQKHFSSTAHCIHTETRHPHTPHAVERHSSLIIIDITCSISSLRHKMSLNFVIVYEMWTKSSFIIAFLEWMHTANNVEKNAQRDGTIAFAMRVRSPCISAKILHGT